jgi:antitoxin component of RelBE/YafQ-DinJ toxin-antitoxin module
MPVKLKMGITLNSETSKNLERICDKTGLDKSYAIALTINYYASHGEMFKIKKTKEKEDL